ncbi:MAG TPA: Os1348 family NHLP clan protein [Candidatus Limnocylindria bacterium]
MASKNLGAVIQRAISDGAFRRQLQSDPAAALRGFNLTADEVAAIRSGDSSKLMSLGVDQRMSKAFSVGGAMAGGAQRASVSDLNAGGTASTIANDPTAGTREGIVGDPTSGARQANPGMADGSRSALDAGTTDTRDALTTGQVSGTRAVHDSAPFDSRSTVSDPTVAGTRAIHDNAPAADLRAAATTGDFAGNTRAVNDSEPFAGNAVVNDNQAAMNAGRGGSLTGDMSVASHMADAGTADSVRAIHDVAPFDSGINTVASTEVIPTDELRAMEHPTGGDAVVDGTTGPDTGNEHSWG